MKIPAINKIKRAVSLLTVAIIFVVSALGQANTGSITGIVTDPAGAVVANATVTVTNQGTNEKRTVQADAEGRYEVLSLPTGVYTIEASGTGFQATSVKDLRLAVGEKARADVALTVLGGVALLGPHRAPDFIRLDHRRLEVAQPVVLIDRTELPQLDQELEHGRLGRPCQGQVTRMELPSIRHRTMAARLAVWSSQPLSETPP